MAAAHDAWLFAEKSKRLWVAAAGPYLDMLLWAIATIVWRVTDPDSGLHFCALVVGAAPTCATRSGVRSFAPPMPA